MKNEIRKVCFVTLEYPPDVGGIGKSSRRITGFLTEASYDVHIFTPMIDREKKRGNFDISDDDGRHIYRVNIYGTSDVDELFQEIIHHVDKSVHFDIFHGFYLFKAYPCLSVANGKRPVIASFRGIDAAWMKKPEFIKKTQRILAEATCITSVSKESLNLAEQIHAISEKSNFIANSIVTSSSEKWQLYDSNRGVVGTVATFRPKKNIPLLVDAYSNLDHDLREKLLLVGDFVLNRKLDKQRKKSFEKLINYFGLKDEVELTGLIENTNVNNFLKKMNVFVLSSIHEGLPNSVLEAATFGMPIVSTAIDGIKDIFDDGKNALLVPPGDLAGMTSSINDILRYDDLAKRLSRGALALRDVFDPEREKAAWLTLYSSLL